MTHATIDIIYLANKRPEFTIVSLLNLLKNTDWSQVQQFYIYVDGDGDNFEQIKKAVPTFSQLQCIARRVGGPVAVLNDATEFCTADYICKIDNDTMVPKGWLEYCLETLRENPVDLLGLEAWAKDPTVFPDHFDSLGPHKGQYSVCPASHVGGIGLFRRAVFEKSRPRPRQDARYGFTEWQWEHPEVTKAFLDPPLNVFLLDHLPFEPWLSLSRQYEAEGIQRRTWGEYPQSCSRLWEWWVGSTVALRPVLRAN